MMPVDPQTDYPNFGEKNRMKSNAVVNATLAGVISLVGVGIAAQTTFAADPAFTKVSGFDKCAGEFVAVGKNDCETSTHDCAGMSKTVSAENWIYVPAGTCEKISGAKTLETKKPQG
jgi:uncharacterized membrane protein